MARFSRLCGRLLRSLGPRLVAGALSSRRRARSVLPLREVQRPGRGSSFGASDHGPVSFRRVGQSVELPGRARRCHDFRDSPQSGCLKSWSRPPQPQRGSPPINPSCQVCGRRPGCSGAQTVAQARATGRARRVPRRGGGNVAALIRWSRPSDDEGDVNPKGQPVARAAVQQRSTATTATAPARDRLSGPSKRPVWP